MVNKKISYALIFITVSLFVVSCVLTIVASEFSTLVYSTWGAFVLCLSAVVSVNKSSLIKNLKRRKTKKLLSTLVSIFLTLCIVLTVNFIARKVNISADITKSKIHSLTDQSSNIVSRIDEKLAMNFFTRRSSWDNFYPLLQMYEVFNKNIKLEMFDIEKEHLLSTQKDIGQENTLEVLYRGKSYKKVITSELDVTNLLIKAISTRKYKIYYTFGHSENDFADETKEGLSFFKKQIINSQYQLIPIDLIKTTKIPSDANLVLLLNPKSSFLKSELKVLDTYIKKGGNTFSMLAPNFSSNDLSALYNLYNQFGITIKNGLVLDKLSTTVGLDPSVLSINKLNRHEITKGIKSRLIMPLNLILSQEKKSETYSLTTLASSPAFPASWGELDLKSLEKGKVFFDETDFKGPLGVSILIDSNNGAAHALFASSVWLTNQYQAQSSHFNLALNTISYILGDNALVSLNRPSLSSEPILLSNFELSLIFYFSVLFLPFLLFALGIYFYQKRARG